MTNPLKLLLTPQNHNNPPQNDDKALKIMINLSKSLLTHPKIKINPPKIKINSPKKSDFPPNPPGIAATSSAKTFPF